MQTVLFNLRLIICKIALLFKMKISYQCLYINQAIRLMCFGFVKHCSFGFFIGGRCFVVIKQKKDIKLSNSCNLFGSEYHRKRICDH